MNKKVIFEYLRTVIIALIFALVIASVATATSKIMAEKHIQMISKISNTAKDNEMILSLIETYKKLVEKNTGDYSLHVKLAKLYELMFNYKEAQEQYEIAILKSPYGVYSSFLGLANLYIKQGEPDKALTVVKQLKNTDHKPLLIAKGDFYSDLGDLYWEKKEYLKALSQYKFAFFFYKKVDSDKKNYAITGILDCYNKIADAYYKKKHIAKAAESLETALLYKKTPIIYYKLAILYKNYDPIKAEEYIEKTYKVDPGLINYDIYEEILINLIKYYYSNNNEIKTDLYKHKLKAIRNFQSRYVFTADDLKINIKSATIKSNLFKTKFKLVVKFNIENTSKNNFNILFLSAKLKYNDNQSKEIYNKRFFSKNEPLESRDTSPEYNIEYNYTKKDEIYNASNIKLEIYATKKENMRKIHLKTIELNKTK